MKRRVSKIGVAAVALAVILGMLLSWFSGRREAFDPTYGFEGNVYRFRHIGHKIFYDESIEIETLEALGAYLSRVGYFTNEYGGIIGVQRKSTGFVVSLTYSQAYWENPEFLQEVSGIRDDLETFALHAPVAIELVDQDEHGIHRERLDYEIPD